AAERRLSSELEGAHGGNEGDAKSAPEQAAKGLGRLADGLKALRQALASGGQLSLGELGGLSQGGSSFDEHGYLVGGHGAYHLVLVFPALQSDEGRELKPAVESIRGARDRALRGLAGKGLQADLTGAPALAVDELKSLQDSSRITSLISTVGIFLLLMLVFRSLRHVGVLLLPLLAGMVISLGFVVLAYGGLNLVTSSFMSVLLGLGIEFGVHLLHRYSEARVDGEDVRPALKTALLSDGPAVALGACTTAAAFLSTTATKFAAFAQLGVITAVGLGVTLVCTIVGFPALLPLLAGKRQPNMHELVGLSTVLRVVGRHARWVLGLSIAATLLAVGSLCVIRPGFNGRTFDFLPAHAESYRGLKRIEESGTPPLDTHFMVDSFDQARELTQKLRRTPEVALVQSPSDLLPPETPERIARIKQAVADLGDYVPVIPAATAAQGPSRLAAFNRLADTLDELSFALRQANLDGGEATRAAHELGELSRWLSGQPDAGASALNRVGQALQGALAR
ncbi:MAG TPA: MMPL family transporter, partial [Polyangiaceae bacterium]|nr:MMPL family transporter [Polyangiaceae bacterium]